MILTVDVLPVSPLPVVRVAVSGTPAGVSWRVTGAAEGQGWLAGEGTSSAGEVVFSDPWAPLGVAVTYTLSAGSTSVVSEPVVRDFRGWHVLTDLSGRVAVDFLWMKAGGDSREWSPRAQFLDVPGSFLSPGSFAPTAGAGTGSLTARTVLPHTATMRDLVRANRPLILLHNHGRRCELRGCDVPLSRTVMLTGVSEGLTSRMDRAERAWELTYRHVPRPHDYRAPVATWVDVAARWPTNADLLASGLSNAELLRGDWLVDE